MTGKNTVLITGAAGFIGYHLVKKLLKEGFNVVGIDSINDYYNPKLKKDRLIDCGIDVSNKPWNTLVHSIVYNNYTFARIALEDQTSLNKLFEEINIDYVINLAAQAGVRYSIENPLAYVNSNIVGFVNILEVCKKHNIKHLVYASSSSVYGNNIKLPLSTSDDVDHPISLYAATKKTNELMAHTYSHLFNIPTTGLRFFTVYGPWGRPDMALFLFTDAIINNRPINVYNNGEMYRDFTFVDDIVEGIYKTMIHIPKSIDKTVVNQDPSNSHTAPYKVYNIGNSSPIKLMDYINTIEECLSVKARINFMAMQPGDVVRTEADVEDLILNVGYKPNTSIKYGIEKFISWYRKYYGV